MGARREVLSAVAERYWPAGRVEKGYILDALCRTTGWHRKHAVRALRQRAAIVSRLAELHPDHHHPPMLTAAVETPRYRGISSATQFHMR